MSTLKNALVAACNADDVVEPLLADRIYPLGDARRNAGYPRLTYQVVTTERDHTLAGRTGLVVAWVQLDAWAYVQADADAIRDAVQDMLEESSDAGLLGELTIRWIRCDGDRDDFERPADASDRGVYRAGFDARVCYCERS